MRRAKVGDIYCAKLFNGYKLFQFAYRIPKRGDYIRVFPGMYESVPDDIAPIVNGSHSYIISMGPWNILRSSVFRHLGTLPVPKEYPFPKFMMKFWKDQKDNIFCFWFTPMLGVYEFEDRSIRSFNASSLDEVPAEYRETKLLNGYVTPEWFLYLLDYNFDLNDVKRYWPQTVLADQWKAKLDEYTAIIEATSDLRKVKE